MIRNMITFHFVVVIGDCVLTTGNERYIPAINICDI